MTAPLQLCRYRSLSGKSADWVRDSIINSKHYFAGPLSFNDPFDCRPNFSLNGTDAELQKYFERLVGRYMPHLNSKARKAEAKRRVTDPSLDPRRPENMVGFYRMYHEQVTQRIGVLCLSESHDDILMWAHYADSHKGVCLVFDPSNAFIATAQPVHYQSIRPAVNPLVHSYDEMLDSAIFTKSDHWAYEREWRLLQYKIGAGVYALPADALVQVVLGAEISDEHKLEVRRWVDCAPSKPRISQAVLSPTSFAVEIRDV